MRNRLIGAARRALPFVLAFSVADAQSFATDPGRAVVRAADVNRDGAVSSAEWTAFRGSLGADADGVVDRARVTARALAVDGESVVVIVRACGSGTSSSGVTKGPNGQKVSKDLPRKNCPPEPCFCHQRALTSLATQ